MDDYIVIDDFMPKKDWQLIHKELFVDCKEVLWNFSSIVRADGEGRVEHTDYQFVHKLIDAPSNYNSPYSYLVAPILHRIKPKHIERVKLNMTVKPITEARNFHVDMTVDGRVPANIYSAVYYVNDHDGYTLTKEGVKVESKANRIFIFKGDIIHTSVHTGNSLPRVVANFVFTKNNNPW